MSEPRAIIGIDLGTTYSLVANLQAGVPTVLPNALGELLTPSAVAIAPDGTTLVGAAARARAVTDPVSTATSFKRDMGTDRVWALGDKTFRAEELSALVLRALKQDAEAALGMVVGEAVVTVPAYFGELQRRATRDACTIAGLHCERIINEPTAAAIAYGLHRADHELRAVVLDLGGGTFDVTVLEIIEGVIEIQGSSGDVKLGGEDFVDALVGYAEERLRSEYGTLKGRHAEAQLREACEQAKRRLSSHEEASLVLPELQLRAGRKDVELSVTRQQAEELWKPLLTRIASPIRRALRDAGADAADIDEVLLVGGSTRMPCVASLAARLFGKLPLRTLPPDEAVAMGAAVQAALKAGDEAVQDVVVTDIAPFSLGVESGTKMGSSVVGGLFSPILERGTVLPASRSKGFVTLGDDQRELLLQIYQGEHSLCADNQKLGELAIRPLPRGKAGEQQVDVRFSYDLNGILEVDAKIVSTGKTFSLLIEKSPGRLSSTQLANARQALKRLKFHPREALPNVTAIERAEALHIELSGIERELLAAALASLRLAIEVQDSATIKETREELNRTVAALRARR